MRQNINNTSPRGNVAHEQFLLKLAPLIFDKYGLLKNSIPSCIAYLGCIPYTLILAPLIPRRFKRIAFVIPTAITTYRLFIRKIKVDRDFKRANQLIWENRDKLVALGQDFHYVYYNRDTTAILTNYQGRFHQQQANNYPHIDDTFLQKKWNQIEVIQETLLHSRFLNKHLGIPGELSLFFTSSPPPGHPYDPSGYLLDKPLSSKNEIE